MTSAGSQPAWSRAAVATVVRAMTPPTERSMPPEMMTSDWPTTAINRNGAVLTRLNSGWESRMAGKDSTPKA